MSFIEDMKIRAKSAMKTIVLPEASDIRILEATAGVLKQGFAHIILIGNKQSIQHMAKEKGLDITGAEIIDPISSDKYNEFVDSFFELRKKKGISIEKAKELMLDTVYFGMMMVKLRLCRWSSIRCYSFYFRYLKTRSSNIKNSTRNQISICLFLNGSTWLSLWRKRNFHLFR